VAAKLSAFVASGSTTLSVNMPQVQLDTAVNGTRILHLHRNVPGVLATVNSVLGDHGINIDRQQLSTRGDTGYLVTDAGNGVTREVIEQILGLPETIRLSTIN
jgi:D-3-phosphoglycerate dehydrogenase